MHCKGGAADEEKSLHAVLALSLVLHKPVTPCTGAGGVNLLAVVGNVKHCFLCVSCYSAVPVAPQPAQPVGTRFSMAYSLCSSPESCDSADA